MFLMYHDIGMGKEDNGGAKGRTSPDKIESRRAAGFPRLVRGKTTENQDIQALRSFA